MASRVGALLAALGALSRAGACASRFTAPPPGLHATDHNGLALKQVCFNNGNVSKPYHVFVIGDWGGRLNKENRPETADDTKSGGREYMQGVDDWAQQRVAEHMKKRAPVSNPDYVLNVGDNFYWAGIEERCGSPPFKHISTGQWTKIFEYVYNGPGLDGKQWLGVLGNHDYGGYHFTNAWDQAIGYTWAGAGSQSSGRWMTPAQYWSVQVAYPGFSVDYYFVDTNAFNAFEPHNSPEHNICGLLHNPAGATCGAEGPKDVWSCPAWFARLWEKEQAWLDKNLAASKATWQIVVTHFPPDFAMDYWQQLSQKHGIDLIITGHRHAQEVHGPADGTNLLRPTAYIVSGGGGGITSESIPSQSGLDDTYGFMDLTFSLKEIKIEAISHGGLLRSTTLVHPRNPGQSGAAGMASTLVSRTRTSTTSAPTRHTSAATTTATLTPERKQVGSTSTMAQAGLHRFHFLQDGTCTGAGMRDITDSPSCEAGAKMLGLQDTTARKMNTAEKIQGCFYSNGNGFPALWLSTDPRDNASGMGPRPSWHAICKVREHDDALRYV